MLGSAARESMQGWPTLPLHMLQSWRVIRRVAGDGGMRVMGQVDLTPQSSGALGRFKAQGRTAESAAAILVPVDPGVCCRHYSVLLKNSQLLNAIWREGPSK